jgi:D-alanyl-D-alanine carboxypeptidase
MSKKRVVQILTLLFISVMALKGDYNSTNIQIGDLNHEGKTDHQNDAVIDQYIQEEMQKRHIPGLSLAVVQNGALIYEKGYGLANVENNVPVTTESVFLLASITKQFTATAIMMLVEEKKISLDDPINKFLPSPPDKWKGITIRHLLTHTSGLTAGCPYSFRDERVSITRQYEYAQNYSIDFIPGDEWQYSDEGYFLLGMIIERVSGQKYADFLSERIFGPLEMTNTKVVDWDKILEHRVQNYTLNSGQLEHMPCNLQIELPSYFGIFSTVNDLAKWDKALYTEKLLTQSSLNQMWTPVKLNNGTSVPYGFGWAIDEQNGHRYVDHCGGTGTEITRYIDDKLTVIVLTNLGSPTPETSEVKSWGLTKKVARFYIPALAYSSIKDTDPNITATVTFFVKNMDRPTMWENDFEYLFSPTLWNTLKAKEPQLIVDAKSFGDFISIDLVEKKSVDDLERFRYRATYKNVTVLWTVKFNKDLKIIDILGEDE